jgi:acetolactate synthase-1/2/3 large subunit
MKLSDYVIDFLATRGITHNFVVSGGAVVHLIDSCAKHPMMNYICAQHEQHGAAEADMYARVSGKMGLVMTTSGPGASNLLTSVCNAFFDSISIICITGQVARFRLRQSMKLRQRGFQETDVVAIFSSVTKYAKQILDPKMIRYELEKACFLASSGRPGPVLLDIPDDLQRVEVEPRELIGFDIPQDFYEIDGISEMIVMLQNAKRPVLLVGAGVHAAKAEVELKKFIEITHLPTLLTWGGKDLLAYDHEFNMGGFGVCGPRGGNFAIQNADLIIAIGTRLSQMLTGGKQNLFAPSAKKIMVDIDEEEFLKFDSNSFCLDLTIKSHLKDFFNVFNEAYLGKSSNFSKWRTLIKRWNDRYAIYTENSVFLEEVNPHIFIKKLSEKCDEEEVVVVDTGATLCWSLQSFKVKDKQRIFSAWNHTPMGYALPASVGAAFAGASNISCIIGDGGFMMCMQELATVKKHQLPIKIFLFNNHGHGIQKQTMDTWLNSCYSAADENSGLCFPDYEKLIESFGIPYYVIDSHKDIDKVLEEVFLKEGPSFCDVHIFKDQKIVPMLKFGNELDNLDPTLSEEELRMIKKEVVELDVNVCLSTC